MRLVYFLLIFLLPLSGCQPKPSIAVDAVAASAPAADANSFLASSRGINYDHEFGHDYTLRWADGPEGEAVGGGSVGPFEDSGQNCCISLPKQWRSGLKLQVKWTALDLSTRKSNKWRTEDHQVELEIPEYRAPGDLYVLFYPGQAVELLVSAHEPGTTGWTGREKQPPLEACTAKHGQKECMKSFPKYPRDSNEAFAERMRKKCTPDAIKKSTYPPGSQAACQSMQKECREQWVIKDKKMCEFDYVEAE
ncbi:DUF3304 domain-containing protein [Chitinolyticbacter albus]|uniref:DUF3304 domain-containing protein n=1 Tax=Chitinolyticbacter albus TaxID=2961951 RepID=UPI00210CCB9E|nr:DUF3304 domain-containing protein [Chitinolyticbacter albus]